MKNKSNKKDKNKDKLVSVGDVVLFLAIIILSIAAIVYTRSNLKAGVRVQISVDGNVVEEFPVDEDKSYEVITDAGTNLVLIEKGRVYVKEADCPDKVCVNHNPISSSGETIICLPHKLVIEIVE